MKLKRNYNEFHDPLIWHDYISIIVDEFPILLVRKYEWMNEYHDIEKITWLVQFFGMEICKIVKVAK